MIWDALRAGHGLAERSAPNRDHDPDPIGCPQGSYLGNTVTEKPMQSELGRGLGLRLRSWLSRGLIKATVTDVSGARARVAVQVIRTQPFLWYPLRLCQEYGQEYGQE